jgi:transposase-like protein
MGKRTYTAEFKAKAVLEVLSGEYELGEVAAGYGINPNQLRNWRSSFLEKAPELFEEGKTVKEAARREEEAAAEKASMLKTIGQLTMERDFLMAQAHERNRRSLRRR